MSGENMNKEKYILGIKDDLRQLSVVMKNEIRKFIRGKKIIVFTLLMGLIIALLAAVIFMFDNKFNSKDVSSIFISFVEIIIVLAVTLFSATSVVSEFEERTALILFTKPIKKWPIFFGKMLASLIIVGIYLLVYYAFTAGISFAYAGDVYYSLPTSLGLSLCYMVGCTGIALFISSIMNKGSTASIMTLVFIILLLPVIMACISITKIDDIWWIISSSPISECVKSSEYTDTIRDAAVMIAWGIETAIVGLLVFRRRDF